MISQKRIGALISTMAIGGVLSAGAADYHVYTGTYTGEKSKGIYQFSFNDATGELKEMGLAAEVSSPSFLAIHPEGKFLYAVNESSNLDGVKSGAVTAFQIEKGSGKLKQINYKGSIGAGPCHLAVHKSGKGVVAANYGGGSLVSFPIKGVDGSLGESATFIQHQGSSANANRQKEPHAHSVNFDATGKYVVAADLGIDEVIVYSFDAETAKVTPHSKVKTSPGGGPRHFAFHPNGKFGYTNLELTSAVTAFTWDGARGELKEIQTLSTLPADYKEKGNSTAEIQVHPSGKFLYCSNRGHDSIAVYTIDEKSGQLAYVENESTRGKTPRNFSVDPSGKFLIAANQSTSTLAVFRIDQKSGALEPMGEPIAAPSPVCVKFLKK